MPRNFYYGKDADIVAGSANFASLIATGFASYGLTSAQSTAFGTLNTALQSAYSAAVNPSTRTPVAIEAKNLALRNMRANAILLAKIVYATATVTDTQLVALGLLPRSLRTPITVPTVPPTIEVISVMGRLVKVRIHDTETERRGLPFGATGANIYSFVGPDAPTDPREYHFEGVSTRAIAEILFPNTVASGATVWLSACWVSARGQMSIGSTPVSFTLQGGAIPAAA
jgi:hypothetical protein